MKYGEFITEWFEIDEAKTGQLIPMRFNAVQERYYKELAGVGIEKGITNPIRELILKARREGFTSLYLALFAADALLNNNPTESMVVSYKIDSTKTFIKRYKNFILSYYRKRWDIHDENKIFKTEASGEIVLSENGARFYCGTASARIGGRGGTLQKLLFSEAAFYPDKQELKAREIIEGTARQVDIDAGWIVIESTANGTDNYYAKVWNEAHGGNSRYIPRFYGWKEFYTPEQFERIKSEITDKRLVAQEFPENPEEAFLSSGDRFFDPDVVKIIKTEEPIEKLNCWNFYDRYRPGHRYALGADVSEGIGQHNSTCVVIDFDATTILDGKQFHKPKVVAVYASDKIAPDLFAHEIQSGGNRFGNCIVAPERNNHGYATLVTLKGIYFNIYKDQQDKLGWQTNSASKPRMMHELRTATNEGLIEIVDKTLKDEILNYPQTDLNISNVDERDETGGHYDRVIALAIAWQMRSFAVPSAVFEHRDEETKNYALAGDYDKYSPFNVVG